MKQTFNINLGGIAFQIDGDAYELLDKYLKKLRDLFGREKGGEEIVRDMESRISELFCERLNENKQVISLVDVEGVIAQLGNPEELGCNPAREAKVEEKKKKVFSCSSKDRILGGFCAGVADYFGWNVWLVRLAMLVLTFFSLTTVFFYFIAVIVCKWKTWPLFKKQVLIIFCLIWLFIFCYALYGSFTKIKPEIHIETVINEF
jgi:phage shock protein PspC (stress-responsive transcriptional regulator)